MKFIHKDLGQRKKGEIVEITLTRGANVRLMDNVNFTSYKNGRKHRYIGGLAKKSPIRLGIPRSGHWHIAIDMQGLREELVLVLDCYLVHLPRLEMLHCPLCLA